MANRTIQDILAVKARHGFFSKGKGLYSPLLGECLLEDASCASSIVLKSKNSKSEELLLSLLSDGKFTPHGECMVYPSKEMRDWSKFAWEKYTLVWDEKKSVCFFKGWASSDYTEFYSVEYRNCDGVIKECVTIDKTYVFSACSQDQQITFFRTLFNQCDGRVIITLEENCPLYCKVVEELETKTSVPISAFKEQDRKDIEVLENMTRRAMFTKEYVKENFPVRGGIYYFEDTNIKGCSFLGEFSYFFKDKESVFFEKVLKMEGGVTSCYTNVAFLTRSCANFRKATKEEIEKHKSAFIDLGNENCGWLVSEAIYYFDVVGDSSYIGKLVSVSDTLVKFSQVVCLNEDGEIATFELEEKEIYKWFISNIRLASEIEIIRFYVGWTNFQRKDGIFSFCPMQWCLMRNDNDELWELCLFACDASANDKEKLFIAVGGTAYHQCISYKGNEYLLGTTKTPGDGKE